MSEIVFFLIPPIIIIIIVSACVVAHCCCKKNLQRRALQQARSRAPPPQPMMTLTQHQRQFMEAGIQQAYANIDPSLQRQYIDFTMEQLQFAPGTVEENRQAELEQQRILQQIFQHTQHQENSCLGVQNTSANNVNGSLNTESGENRSFTIPVTAPTDEGVVPPASRQDTVSTKENSRIIFNWKPLSFACQNLELDLGI